MCSDIIKFYSLGKMNELDLDYTTLSEAIGSKIYILKIYNLKHINDIILVTY